MEKLQLGQELWWVPYERRIAPSAAVVTKIGRKWAELNSGYRIDMVTLVADGGEYASPGRCYLSKAEHDAETERRQAWGELRHHLGRSWTPPEGVTLDAIREAARLLALPHPSRGD